MVPFFMKKYHFLVCEIGTGSIKSDTGQHLQFLRCFCEHFFSADTFWGVSPETFLSFFFGGGGGGVFPLLYYNVPHSRAARQHAANFVFPGRNSEAGKSFERIQFFTGFTQKQRTIKITQIVLISQSSSETVEAVLCRI